MGRRNSQGAVSIDQDKNTIRLRWRYQSKRYSLNLFLYNKQNLLQAKKIALTIESDLVTGAFDYTLEQYKTLVAQVSHPHLFENCNSCTPAKETSQKKKSVVVEPHSSILKDFDRYLTAKSMDPQSDDLSSYYTQTRAMLKKWGDFDPEDTPVLLSKERFGPKKYLP